MKIIFQRNISLPSNNLSTRASNKNDRQSQVDSKRGAEISQWNAERTAVQKPLCHSEQRACPELTLSLEVPRREESQ